MSHNTNQLYFHQADGLNVKDSSFKAADTRAPGNSSGSSIQFATGAKGGTVENSNVDAYTGDGSNIDLTKWMLSTRPLPRDAIKADQSAILSANFPQALQQSMTNNGDMSQLRVNRPSGAYDIPPTPGPEAPLHIPPYSYGTLPSQYAPGHRVPQGQPSYGPVTPPYTPAHSYVNAQSPYPPGHGSSRGHPVYCREDPSYGPGSQQ
ncbi:hypothetical protein NLJ89_g2356 [Agrocybe chaxingu]|uniref:Uncharacterized protein n=1 Tax=Agrocybe chaxingu TaxID=84603 RepID=A0A9W8KCC7_9AGAR|nr:hypothetical protein NLJ89_g2356 [Agrocybe chaxingu]